MFLLVQIPSSKNLVLPLVEFPFTRYPNDPCFPTIYIVTMCANEGLWTIDGILFYVIIMMVIIDEASIIIKALVFMPNSGYEFEIIWWGGTGIGARQPHLLMGYEWHGVKHYGCQIIFWMCLISFWEWNLSSRSWVIIPRGARSFLLLLLRTLLASTYVF